MAECGEGGDPGHTDQLQFLPVPHTDFIFSAFAEEHGFVGVVVVLGLYFLLLMQIVQNAQTAPDRAGMYICMGSCRNIVVSRSGERRDGGRPDAGNGNPFAANEFRRLEYAFGFYDAGAGEQCPAPAIC